MVALTIDENNNKVIQELNLNIQETIILRSVEEYFSDENNFNILKTIIDGNNDISRRTIEYFVTKYSNLKNTTYFIENLNKKVKFNVYSSYKDKLKCHKKNILTHLVGEIEFLFSQMIHVLLLLLVNLIFTNGL